MEIQFNQFNFLLVLLPILAITWGLLLTTVCVWRADGDVDSPILVPAIMFGVMSIFTLILSGCAWGSWVSGVFYK